MAVKRATWVRNEFIRVGEETSREVEHFSCRVILLLISKYNDTRINLELVVFIPKMIYVL